MKIPGRNSFYGSSPRDLRLWSSRRVTADSLEEAVAGFSRLVEKNDVPSDGLVLLFDDIAYGQSLGRTAKFPRDSIAFKWADEIQETTLSYISGARPGQA